MCDIVRINLKPGFIDYRNNTSDNIFFDNGGRNYFLHRLVPLPTALAENTYFLTASNTKYTFALQPYADRDLRQRLCIFLPIEGHI